jgi:hypothetical protein
MTEVLSPATCEQRNVGSTGARALGVRAKLGQAETHNPQPVQSMGSISTARRMVIAVWGQMSLQMVQVDPRTDKQC